MRNSRVRLRYDILETPGLPAEKISQEEYARKFLGSTALPKPKTYTGDKMLGVATMHKSNAVPVFSQESAQDISKMRR